jgi:hypothetical protein
MDVAQRWVMRGGQPVELTAREFDLLQWPSDWVIHGGLFSEIAEMTGALHPEFLKVLTGTVTFLQALESGEMKAEVS